MEGENVDASIEKDSFLRFFVGTEPFFENFSVWKVESDIANREIVFRYPLGATSLAENAQYVFPSAENLTDIEDQIFHIATINSTGELRIIYSLIFKTKGQFNLTNQSEITIPKQTLLIMSIQSKYLHPSAFRNILVHILNHLPYPNLLNNELFSYIHPQINRSIESTEIVGVPFNISSSAEIGRFHHFIFSSFKVNQVLHILLYLLSSFNFHVMSVSTSQLSIGCFSLLSLMYPIQWPNIFITALPEHSLEYVSPPYPYIIGLPVNLLSNHKLTELTADVNINFDFADVVFNQINQQVSIQIDSKYAELIKCVESLIEEELKAYRTTNIFPAYKIQLYLWQYMTGIALITADLGQTDLDPESFEITLANALLKMAKKTPHSIPRDSIQRMLLESNVISHFCNGILYSRTTKIPKAFFDVIKDLKPLMKAAYKKQKAL